MFIAFFYLLKEKGLNISTTEWITLLTALENGLHKCSFTEFYYLCRAILVKSEADFDKFDSAFLEYFKDLKLMNTIPQELLDWLNNPEHADGAGAGDDVFGLTYEEVQKLFRERLASQKGQHNGGNMFIGTQGNSKFGNNPAATASPNEGGIRVAGEGQNRSAFQIAGDREFRDFRNDVVVNERQFQMAFRRLRQFSSRVDAPKTELDIDETIDETCNSGGHLKVVFDKPRKNTVKLLLMMDSGGSMDAYSAFCTALFKAVNKSNHFKDLKVYYFHNCIYNKLYTDPTCSESVSVPTDWVLKNLDSEYKVIILGDAGMAPFELMVANYYVKPDEKPISGLEWMRKFKKRYHNIVWLNPMPKEDNWGVSGMETYDILEKEFDMYYFTIKNLEKALKKLISGR